MIQSVKRTRENRSTRIILYIRKVHIKRKSNTFKQRILSRRNTRINMLFLRFLFIINSIRNKLHIIHRILHSRTFGVKNSRKTANILTTVNSSKKPTREEKRTDITPKRTVNRRLGRSCFQLAANIYRRIITAQNLNNTNRLNITKIRIIYHDVRKRVIRAFRRSERCFFDKRHNFSVINFSCSVNSKPV